VSNAVSCGGAQSAAESPEQGCGSANSRTRTSKCWEQLYRTAGGAFFIVRLTAPESGSDDEDVAWDEQWVPLSRAEADEWFRNGVQITLHEESVFALPEEAKAEDEDEEERTVALTVRVPSTLHDRLVRAADKEHLSMNTYILRCVDRCLEGPRVVS
jgi:HicB family